MMWWHTCTVVNNVPSESLTGLLNSFLTPNPYDPPGRPNGLRRHLRSHVPLNSISWKFFARPFHRPDTKRWPSIFPCQPFANNSSNAQSYYTIIMSDAAFGISLPMWSEHQHEHIRVSLLAQVSAAICTTAAFITFNDDLNLRGRLPRSKNIKRERTNMTELKITFCSSWVLLVWRQRIC
jgi:hypothetical protein